MKTKFLAFLFFLLSVQPVVGQIKVDCVVSPEPHAISHNIVFVIDASSSINYYPSASAKFDEAWRTLVSQIGMDELYFKVIIFHDKKDERALDWSTGGIEEFEKAKRWVKNNTGTYSWGMKAMRMALREKSPLDKNPDTSRGLTVILMTDGGLTEAADTSRLPPSVSMLNSTLDKHVYFKTGDFRECSLMIKQEQKARLKRGLYEASIMTIGIRNIEADLQYGTGVKRPDKECQEWLKMLGGQYGGGYFYVYIWAKKE